MNAVSIINMYIAKCLYDIQLLVVNRTVGIKQGLVVLKKHFPQPSAAHW